MTPTEKVTKRERLYLLREGHVLGCFFGTGLYAWWPPLAGVYLAVLVVLWIMAWRGVDA